MSRVHLLSRREVLATMAAGASTALFARPEKRIPVGLMLFAVRQELERDLPGTLQAVAQIGFEGVEFFGPYIDWTPAAAKQIRAQLDSLGMRCLSTHNEAPAFTPEGLSHAIELNQILGSPNIVCVRGLAKGAAKGFEGEGLDGWKRIADKLKQASERLGPLKMTCGFHNHAVEFIPINGTRPIDILARNNDLQFHLNVGLCRQGKADPIAFIEQYPGRMQAVLCTDSPNDASGHPPLIGKGTAPWKQIFAAAERTGGVRFYLIQQEGSEEPPLEAVRQDLQFFHRLHASI
jgi:sugar phosphate isomerase/epimerase